MPLTNEDIVEFKKLLTEIRDELKHVAKLEIMEIPKEKKLGRPKGKKNVKRTGKS